LKRRFDESIPEDEDPSIPPENDTLPEDGNNIIERIRKVIREDIIDPDTWRGAWYMLNYTYEYQTDNLKRRIRGEYETDDFGLDMEFLNSVYPIFEFMYKKYWRVQTAGFNNIPNEGPAVLVANHSGQVPWDTIMLSTAIKFKNPADRLVRTLYDPAFSKLPVFSNFFDRIGQTVSSEQNAIRLLESDELLAYFPEGYQGISKKFKDRYKLSRFHNLDFIKVAILKNTPILPVSIVGAEEAYISLANSQSIANFFGVPYFSITPTWPFLGPLGSIPIPSKWFIDISPPILLEDYPPESSKDIALVNHLAEYIRQIIQQMINKRLITRDSILFG
jgi:1-acyl-sn-glycerol-3-phosphate acyltransferase